jgi:hypothetical protein
VRTHALLLTGALVATIGATPADSASLTRTADAATGTTAVDADAGIGSDNLEFVKNLPHTTVDGQPGAGGSDIEFFTLDWEVSDFARTAARTGVTPADDLDGDLRNGVQRRYALAGTLGNGVHIYDITVPEETFRTARYDCSANQGDSQIFTREEDGVTRTYATYTTEDTRPVAADRACAEDVGATGEVVGTFIIDITDPYAPESRAFIDVPEGSHNGSVHPSGDYFYNSNSSLYVDTALDGGPGIEYYDISNLDDIERLGRLPLPPIPASLGTESHDITFNADGDRAYSAALSQGVIINTQDPADPEILTSWVDPTINVWHQADPIQVGDRTLLVVEDEVAGAVGTGQCPNGGVHVFDVTGDPAVPTKLGYWNIDEVRVMATEGGDVDPAGGCTAHVFRLYPEQNVMTISYYNGGVRVVDLGGLVGVGLGKSAVADHPVVDGEPMTQLAYHRFEDSNSWASKTPHIEEDGSFYLFSNDINRGLDIYHYTGGADAEAAAQGRWMTPTEAAATLTRYTPAQLTANPQFVCFL